MHAPYTSNVAQALRAAALLANIYALMACDDSSDSKDAAPQNDGSVADTAVDGTSEPGLDGAAIEAGPGVETGPDVPLTACTPSLPLRLGTGTSATPRLLWDGAQYIVLWGDARSDAPGIYLSRLTPQGVPLGATDTLVAAGSALAKNPQIARHSGGTYVVVWEECAEISGQACNAWKVQARALSAELVPTGTVVELSPGRKVERRPYVLAALGKVFVSFRDAAPADPTNREWITVFSLDATGAAAATPAAKLFDVPGKDTRFPSLAANQTNLALVYAEGKNQSDVVLALLDANLTLVRDVRLRSGTPGEAYNPQAAWLGGEWLVAWEDKRSGDEQAWMAFVASDATAVRSAAAIYGDAANWPVVATNGTTALVAFYAFPSGLQVLGQQVSLSGSPIRAPFGISPLKTQNGRFPALVHNPTTSEYAVAYLDQLDQKINFVRLPCPN